MANIESKMGWEANKPSRIHCGQCGSGLTITPTASDLRDGFLFYCIKCGARFHYGDPKPVPQKLVELKPIEPSPKNSEHLLVLGYPQTRQLFERKKVSEWLKLMVGDILSNEKTTAIASKIKSYYRFRFDKNPTKTKDYNLYSGIELNACMERMYVADKMLATELKRLYLEKIRNEIEVGSIVVNDYGTAREVVEIIGDVLVLDIEGHRRQLDRSTVVNIVNLLSKDVF